MRVLYRFSSNSPQSTLQVLSSLDKEPWRSVELYLARGRAYAKLQRMDLAERDYTEVLKQADAPYAISAALTFFQQRLKAPKKALPLLQQRIKQSPKRAFLHLFHSKLLLQLGHKKSALKAAKHAAYRGHAQRLWRHLIRLLAYKLQQPRQAIETLQAYTKKHPDDPWAWILKGQLYERSRAFAAARQSYMSALNTHALIPSQYGKILRFLLQQPQATKQAMRLYKRALKEYPHNGDLVAGRGALWLRLNQWREAVKDFIKASQLQPWSIWKARRVVLLLQKHKQHKEALTFLRKRLQLFPRRESEKKMYLQALQRANMWREADRFAIISLGKREALLKGKYFLRRGKSVQAIGLFTSYLRQKGLSHFERANGYLARAHAYQKVGQPGLAAQDLWRAIDARPTARFLYQKLASLYRHHMRTPAKAIGVWSTFLQQVPGDQTALRRRGRLYESLHDLPAAAFDYMQLLHRPQASASTYARLSAFYLKKVKRRELALRVWDLYIERHPKQGEGHQRKASLYMRARRYEDAKAELEKALALEPTVLFYYTKLSYLLRYRLKKPWQAVTLWTAFIQNAPKRHEGYLERGRLYRSLKQTKKATRDLRRSIILAPRSYAPYAVLGALYRYETRQYKQAILVWDRYLHVKPKSYLALKARAELYEKIGRWAQALRDWRALRQGARGAWLRKRSLRGMIKNLLQLDQAKKALGLSHLLLGMPLTEYELRQVHRLIAECYEGMGKYALSLMRLRRILQTSRGWLSGKDRLWRNRLIAANGRWREALEDARAMCKGTRQLSLKQRRLAACGIARHLGWWLVFSKGPY